VLAKAVKCLLMAGTAPEQGLPTFAQGLTSAALPAMFPAASAAAAPAFLVSSSADAAASFTCRHPKAGCCLGAFKRFVAGCLCALHPNCVAQAMSKPWQVHSGVTTDLWIPCSGLGGPARLFAGGARSGARLLRLLAHLPMHGAGCQAHRCMA
jgi:hypothetical protein